MRKEHLDGLKALVDSAMANLKLPEKPKGLYEPVAYVLGSGGKRLRPVLLLAVVKAVGGVPERYISQALALEIYHNFTLLHDDVMDNADMRHRRPTVHKKWNVATSILSGDVMLSLASSMMMKGLPDHTAPGVMAVFNDTQIKIDEGQQMDMDFETAKDVSLAEYEEMISLKTGVLFGCACAIGGCVAMPKDDKRHSGLLKSLVKYGCLLGITFQLQDDLLDTFGNEANFGKQIGGDIVNNKKTWLLISALNSRKRREVEALLNDAALSPREKIDAVTAIYNALGLKEKLEKRIGDNIKSMNDMVRSMQSYIGEDGVALLNEFTALITGRER